MRIAFIGHSYHFKTSSNRFLLDLLERCGEVETFADATWEGERGSEWAAGFRQEEFDCVVVFQAHEAFAHLDTSHPNLVFVPMYDAMLVDNALWWQPAFSAAKVLCLSAALYRDISATSPARFFAQYFPDPRGLPAAEPAGHEPSGFFWYRRPTVTPELLARLTGESVFDRLTIHWSPDPVGEPEAASDVHPRARRVERTTWFPDRASYLALLAEHGVYFASRLYEGIGMGFLEAMAMGLCVVAPALPTHDEYISHGTDGLLYLPSTPSELSFARHRELGRRARERAARGRTRWERVEGDVCEFLCTPREELARARTIVDFFHRAQGAPSTTPSSASQAPPKVTVVTVCLNAAAEIERTLLSVREQDYPALEYVVVDGASTDGTIEILERHHAEIDSWCSRPDQRVYTSMMDSLAHVTGEYVVYMNAGDSFASRSAVSSLFATAPPEADAVFGRHVFVRGDGVDELRPSADFDEIVRDLELGHLGQRWLESIPCHQAIAVRASLLREHGFDPVFRLAADHDLYFRLQRAGARFHDSADLVAIYHAGGLSGRAFELCVEEWVRIAVRYGRFTAARRFYSRSGLASRQLWAAALRGWTDRIAGRRRRRFGREFSAAGSPLDFDRKSFAARVFDGLVEGSAGALAGLERLLPGLLGVEEDANDGTDGGETVYRARPEQGIDFRRAGRPQFVASWSGLSYREEWGRWSDGSLVEIQMKSPLPVRARFLVDAHAFGANAEHPVRLTVGDSSALLRISGLPIRTYAAELETSGRERALSLEIPFPTAPQPAQSNAPPDSRRIGIGLQRLRVLRSRS